MNGKNQYGQYMTPEIIARFMISIAEIDNSSKILEPCSGEGVFLKELSKQGFNNVTAYEIDNSLIKDNPDVINESFVSSEIKEKFDLIIGNPPYIRWKNLEEELKFELEHNPFWNKYCNSLCDYSAIFIMKAIEKLKEGGQLIFITPEYWMNTTHSIRLRNFMLEHGYFQEIYHFNETPIFEKVNVSTVIFKFIKSKAKNKEIRIVKYFKNKKLNENVLENLRNDSSQDGKDSFYIPQFEIDKNWILAKKEIIEELKIFENKCRKKDSKEFYTFGEFCDIGNGLVSGLDKTFQVNGTEMNDFEKTKTIDVLKAKNLNQFTHEGITKYIFVEDIDSEEELKRKCPNFYSKLNPFRNDLEKRYQYGKKIFYWKWVFLRNFELFSKPFERIFIPCKERISHKDYFRFSFVERGIYPTQDVTAIFKKESTQESIFYLLAILNSKFVFDWLKNNGIVKGNIVEFSEKPIFNIPYRKINFENEEEKKKHDEIVELVKKYIQNKDETFLDKINKAVNSLFI